MGKATRKAPAQTELRPTSAGAFRAVLPYDATPQEFLCQLVDQFVEDNVVGEATHVGRVRLRPNRGFPGEPALRCDPTHTPRPAPRRHADTFLPMGKATREAPAQTELRPTSAGAFRVVLPYDAPPQEFLCQLVDQIVGDDVVGKATLGSPGSDGASPYQRRAFPRDPAL